MARDRENILMVTCGQRGIGKTYQNKILANYYVKGSVGRPPRPVLVYDINKEEEYYGATNVQVDPIITTAEKEGKNEKQIQKLISDKRIKVFKSIKKPGIYKAMPFDRKKDEYSPTEKRKLLFEIIKGFKNGLLIVEDLDRYATHSQDQEIVGKLTSLRHVACDILITHQSLSKPSKTERENCNYFRMHRTQDTVFDSKGKYEQRTKILMIAENIVVDEYQKRNKYFHVYINMDAHKVENVTKESFIKAAQKYINATHKETVKLTYQYNWGSDQKKYSIAEAANQRLKQLMEYYGGKK